VGPSALGLSLTAGCGLLAVGEIRRTRPARVGLLSASRRVDVELERSAFLARAAELGWRAGDTMVVEERYADGQRDAVVPLAGDLARLPVDVIVAGGTIAIQAARQATTTIPVVMAGLASNPVMLGLIESFAHPGGNVTGLGNVSPVLSTKRLELLALLVPGLSRVSVLVTPDNPSKAQNIEELQGAADRLGVTMRVEDVIMRDLPRAFEAARASQAQALLLIGDAVLTTVIPSVVALVHQLRLPTMYADRAFVDAGGLMAYYADSVAVWQRAAEFVDKILRGTKPADLPVELPRTYHFAVNVNAARGINIVFPRDVGAQVTEWLE
jgi:putative ABC transport system substrate-binding protein